MHKDAEDQKTFLREEVIEGQADQDVHESRAARAEDFDVSDTLICSSEDFKIHETSVDSAARGDTSDAPTEITAKIIGGHYQIISKIGEGGVGTVYKAKHLLLDRIVALKIISPERRLDANALMRFQQEAKAVTSLNHPNIVRTYEYGVSEDGNPYLTMEYVEGETLAGLISSYGKQPVDVAVELISQVGQGLTHAHTNGVIHRDIKPENIVLFKGDDGKRVAKILDFGIAKLIKVEEGQKLTETGNIVGSPLYMSPEQCHGRKLDARSDIYSLGCVLYELVTGTPPFRGESAIETLVHHIQTPVPDIPVEDVPPLINECLQKALAKQPEKRFQSVQQFLSALCSALNVPARYSGVNDPRFWRSLDRKYFVINDPKEIELFQQRILSRMLFYVLVAIVVLSVGFSGHLNMILDEAKSSQFADPAAWSKSLEAGKRAHALGDYYACEQFLLDAEGKVQFTGGKQQRILVLQELKKLYEERGLHKDANQISQRILMIQNSGR